MCSQWYVEIVGSISQATLKRIGKTYGRNGYLLTPEVLDPVTPRLYDPEDVREAMYK